MTVVPKSALCPASILSSPPSLALMPHVLTPLPSVHPTPCGGQSHILHLLLLCAPTPTEPGSTWMGAENTVEYRCLLSGKERVSKGNWD